MDGHVTGTHAASAPPHHTPLIKTTALNQDTEDMASSLCACLAGLFGPSDGGGTSSKDGAGIEMDRGGGGGGGRAMRLQYKLQPKGPGVVVVVTHRSSSSSSAATTGPLIKGRGVALVSIPLEQDSCYFELHVRKAGAFTVGVSRAVDDKKVLAEGPLAWGLEVEPAQLELQMPHEASVEVVPESEGRAIPVRAKAGDVVGVVFSQSSFPMLGFTLNGRALPGKAVERVRGLVYPAVHVKRDADKGGDEGPCVSWAFDESEWAFKPPSSRYSILMESRDML